jgi:hypothetical protein
MSTPIPTINIGGFDAGRLGSSPAAEAVAEAAAFVNQPGVQQLEEMAEAAGGWHALLGSRFDLASIRTPGLNEAVILMMMRQRLSDLDFQADEAIRQVETTTAEANALQTQLSAIQDVRAAMANKRPKDDQRVDLSTLMLTLDDGREVSALEYLEAAGVDMNSLGMRTEGEHANTMTGQAMSSVEGSLSSELRKANSGNEMRMVQLQSVMQQRGQITQLGSNMLSSLNDTARAIIQNTK